MEKLLACSCGAIIRLALRNELDSPAYFVGDLRTTFCLSCGKALNENWLRLAEEVVLDD